MVIAIDTSFPDGSTDPPSVIDDDLRSLKSGLQEYVDVDHFADLVGNDWSTVAQGAGQHRQVTFKATIAAPVPTADQAFLYTTDDGGDPEISFIADGYAARQLTLNGAINIIEADFATTIDGTSNIEFVAGVLTIKVDDVTIEYDGSVGLQQKIPAVGADGEHSEAIFLITGKYTGNGGAGHAQVIGTGVTVRHLVLHRTSGTHTAIEMTSTDSGYEAWGQIDGADQTSIIAPSANGFTVEANTRTNTNGIIYRYSAWCKRT